MNTKRRFGVLTAIAGAALALGSLTFAGSANAVELSNFTDHEGNITVCPAGQTKFEGQITSGSGDAALFHWAVTEATYVTVTAIDPSVTGLTAYIKGGDGYRVYSPVYEGQQMRSPTNNGGQVPTLSHWMLCYTVTEVTTTTELVTTTTELVTTTTEIVTTTTESDSGGPTTTTTVEATTTTELDSGGPTTTEVDDEGGDLPTTGSTPLLLVLGLAMLGGGVIFTLLGRSPHES